MIFKEYPMSSIVLIDHLKMASLDQQQTSDQSDGVDEDLWSSPPKPKPQPPPKNAPSRNQGTPHGEQDVQETALRRELQTVRKVNEALETAIESLSQAQNSMKVRPSLSHPQPVTHPSFHPPPFPKPLP
jgi:hypothetical protein